MIILSNLLAINHLNKSHNIIGVPKSPLASMLYHPTRAKSRPLSQRLI